MVKLADWDCARARERKPGLAGESFKKAPLARDQAGVRVPFHGNAEASINHELPIARRRARGQRHHRERD